jgi:hypothetical protein
MAGKNTSQHPLQPSPKGVARDLVQFDSSTIALSDLPPLKLQAPEVTDRGIVRFGSSTITSAR